MIQKEFIRKLMKSKGIETDQELLYKILNNLSKKGYKINTIEKEKGNFSHMLNGDRKFTYPYIIALEEVLETSLANIINQIDEHVITPKGFEYVASQNNYELFKALDEEEDIYKFSVLKNKDEYDKTVIDYIIEYKAVMGVMYLIDFHELKYNDVKGYLELDGKKYYDNTNQISLLATMLIEKNRFDLYECIFDSFELLYFENSHKSAFTYPSFLNAIIQNEKTYKQLFETRKINLGQITGNKRSTEQMYVLNPLANIVFNFALKNVDIYNEQLKLLLEKGYKANEFILGELVKKYPMLDDVNIKSNGILTSYSNSKIYTLIFTPSHINSNIDKDIKYLIYKNEKLIKKYLFKEGNKNDILNEKKIIDFIMMSSGISSNLRDSNEVFNTIIETLKSFKCSMSFKQNIHNHLYKYLDDKVNSLNKDSDTYLLEYENIQWCKIFVDLYGEELSNIDWSK